MIPTPKNETLPPPPSRIVEPPSPTAPGPIQTTSDMPKKPSTFDRFTNVASTIGNTVQQGLSYANARRARSTYRG